MSRRVAALLSTLAVLATVGISAAPATTASTSSGAKICVALVVDFADLGRGVQSTCATIRQGQTGYDVLTAAGHRFTICSNGVLGEIDGQPANGCQIKDDTHYWTYWHRAPGAHSWTYSDEGAGTYEPRNASTEGWRWRDGGSLTPPADVPYSDICKSKASPSPSPSATPTPRQASTHAPTRRPAVTGATTPTPTPQVTHGNAAATTSAKPHHAKHNSAVVRSPTPDASPTALATDTAGDSRNTTNGSAPYGLIAGLVLVVGLGGVAGWRLRRRGDGG